MTGSQGTFTAITGSDGNFVTVEANSGLVVPITATGTWKAIAGSMVFSGTGLKIYDGSVWRSFIAIP